MPVSVVNLRRATRAGVRARIGVAASLVAAAGMIGLAAAPASAIVPPDSDTVFRDALAALTCDGNPDTITISNHIVFENTGDPTYTCDDDLTIESTDGDHFTIDATTAGTVRFLVSTSSDATITIRDLSIQGFSADSGSGSGLNTWGGAIWAQGPVDVYGSVFASNSVTGDADNSTFGGGAIASAEDVNVYSSAYNPSTFTGNSVENTGSGGAARGGAIQAGAGFYAEGAGFYENSVYAEGSGTSAAGGAIYSEANAEDWESTYSLNTATSESGIASGGAIDTTVRAEIHESSFDHNAATALTSDALGGAIRAGEVEIYGADFVNNLVDNGGDGGGGAVASGYAEITGCEFVDNYATGNGTGGTVGGAVWNDGGGFFVQSTFTHNAVTDGGDSSLTGGGALATQGTNYVVYSTFEGNEVTIGNATGDALGGAFLNYYNGTVLYASTLVDNSALGGLVGEGSGGAAAAAAIYIISSTLTGNTADVGSQVYADNFASFATVLAGGYGADNCSANVLDSHGYNFDDDGSCFPSTGTDMGDGLSPKLGPLQDNGGPTETRKPTVGSPLIDAIPDYTCTFGGPAFTVGLGEFLDQRGYPRPTSGCDIGAVEVADPVTFTIATPAGDVHGTVYDATGVTDEAYTDVTTLGTPPADVSFPVGALGYTINVPGDGWTVTVKLELPVPVNELWKYTGGVWDQLPGVKFSNGGKTVMFDLQDGGVGDDDEDENSIIVDPAAPGVGASFTG